MTNTSTTDILDRGTACLRKNLGVIETEAFIAAVMRERFDYTEWQRKYFADKSLDELNDAAVAYCNSKN